MIITEVFYGLKCNRCMDVFSDGDHSFWDDKGEVVQYAFDNEWIEQGGKHYCPSCYDINDNTHTYDIKEAFTDNIKSLNKFIDRCLERAYYRTISEDEKGMYNIKFMIGGRLKLEMFEETFIKNLIGIKFYSIEYLDFKTSSATCLIKVVK